LSFDFGVRIDLGGEKIFLVDNTGRLLDRMTAFAALASLYLSQHAGSTLAVPVGVPALFEQMAEANNGRVIYTRSAAQAIMAEAGRRNVGLAGDGDGGFIFPSFLPAFDSMLAIAKLMES